MPFADKAADKACKAAYYQKNRAAVIARNAAYREANYDKLLPKRQAYWTKRNKIINAQAKAGRLADPETYREKDRTRYAANGERERAIDAARYDRDRDKIKARTNAYRLNNPDKRADAQQRRRALKAGAIAETILRADILLRDGPLCAFCRAETIPAVHRQSVAIERHYDHIIPLSRGGNHVMSNMRILCRTCNCRKRSRLDDELPPSLMLQQGSAHAG